MWCIIKSSGSLPPCGDTPGVVSIQLVGMHEVLEGDTLACSSYSYLAVDNTLILGHPSISKKWFIMILFMPLEKNILQNIGKYRAIECILMELLYIIIDRKILEMFQAVVNQRTAAINWIGWKFINAKVYNYS